MSAHIVPPDLLTPTERDYGVRVFHELPAARQQDVREAMKARAAQQASEAVPVEAPWCGLAVG